MPLRQSVAFGARRWLGWLKGLKLKIDKIEGIEKDITQVKTDLSWLKTAVETIQDDIKELFSDAPPNFVADGRPPTVLRR